MTQELNIEWIDTCPFCKGDAHEVVGFDMPDIPRFIECKDCGATTAPFYNGGHFKAWNARLTNHTKVTGFEEGVADAKKRIKALGDIRLSGDIWMLFDDLQSALAAKDAEIAELRRLLEASAKRSNYVWSESGSYTAQDWKNEGAIELAKTAALAQKGGE